MLSCRQAGPRHIHSSAFCRAQAAVCRGKSDEARLALQADDKRLFLSCISNALEPPAAELLPSIGHILKRLRRCGALAAGMSGSGSACFAVFDDKKRRLQRRRASSMPVLTFAAYSIPYRALIYITSRICAIIMVQDGMKGEYDDPHKRA